MKYLFQVVIFLNLLAILGVNASENTTINVGEALKINKAFENTKFILAPAKKTRELFKINIQKISSECCDEDFPNKKKIR